MEKSKKWKIQKKSKKWKNGKIQKMEKWKNPKNGKFKKKSKKWKNAIIPPQNSKNEKIKKQAMIQTFKPFVLSQFI